MARLRDSRAELIAAMAELLREQGYAATGRAELLRRAGVSNGSLYHHFPGGMEELAETALETSGEGVANALRVALAEAPDAGVAISRFLETAEQAAADGGFLGCPIAPTALESPIISPRLRTVAARAFDQWEDLLADRLRADGWREAYAKETAAAALALIEGALLLDRVGGENTHIESARRAAVALVAAGPKPIPAP